jgi:hypothetical protein
MSTDYGEEKRPLRERLLACLLDMHWHRHDELARVGGNRYSARMLELKRLGYLIEDETLPDGTGKGYRLVSAELFEPQKKRVKAFLEEADVEQMLETGAIPADALMALEDALASFKANKEKL